MTTTNPINKDSQPAEVVPQTDRVIMPSEHERPDNAQHSAQRKYDMYAQGVLFLIALGLTMIISMILYAAAHGINYFQIYLNPKLVFTVDFIGGGRNAYSIGFEAALWAFLGVSCRIAYIALKAMQDGKFRFLRFVAIWFGTIGFAWGVSVALILSLSVVTVSIGTTEITLANASIETLIAISFIIGFYNEQALVMLERVRDKFTAGIDGQSDSKNSKSS